MKTAAFAALALLATAAAAQAQEPGRVWSVATPKDGDSTLTYGIWGTPDLPLGLSCTRKSGQVLFTTGVAKVLGVKRNSAGVWLDQANLAAPWPASVTFKSGEQSSTLRGSASAWDGEPGTRVSGEISTRAPVLAAFRKTGELSFTTLGETAILPPAKPAMIRKFLSACK